MGLENITRHIILDISKNKYISVTVNQYDNNVRDIIAKITNNGKPYPLDSTIQARIKCKKSDGHKVFNDCSILEDGSVYIEITDQMTIVNGLHDCELALYDSVNDKVLHTMDFVLNVQEAILSDEEMSSTDEFIALDNALLQIGNLKRITESEIDALFS